MSKDYRGALYYLMTETVAYNDNKLIPLAEQALDDLQELVKRNEPMKPIKQNDSFGLCPICKQDLGRTNYCETCGQRLDWSDEK